MSLGQNRPMWALSRLSAAPKCKPMRRLLRHDQGPVPRICYHQLRIVCHVGVADFGIPFLWLPKDTNSFQPDLVHFCEVAHISPQIATLDVAPLEEALE